MVKEVCWDSLDWIHLAWDKDKWWLAMNAVTTLQVPQNTGNFWTT